ncbi:MAG: FMN-binding protein [Gemmatimonadota bacterium]|nr:MAG: FMN-binding protein [Gemmatimonadota bacterium]
MTAEERQVGSPVGGAAPQKQEVPPWRLLATLGTAGAMAGFLIVFVFVATEPAIKAHKAEVLRLAIQEVLKGPARFDTLFVHEGALQEQLPPGMDAEQVEQIYVGYAEDGSQVGFAIASAEPGFQDIIRLIFGYDSNTGATLGMKVLESKETPGLGDKIEKDMTFVQQFDAAVAPLVGVSARQSTGDEHEIDMITGVTISSRAVIRIINNSLERLGPLLESYNGGGSQ